MLKRTISHILLSAILITTPTMLIATSCNKEKLSFSEEVIETKNIKDDLNKLKENYQEKQRLIEMKKRYNEIVLEKPIVPNPKELHILVEVSFYHDELRTASGVYPRVGTTIAMPREIPFNSIVTFEGNEYICQDRGGYIQKVWYEKYNQYVYRVDVYEESEYECYRKGRYITNAVVYLP